MDVLVVLHLLGATVWTGGHLVLALSVLPAALRRGEPEAILAFESAYERVGLPALAVQVATGLWLAYRLVPDTTTWFTFQTHRGGLIAAKLIMLALTVALAAHARLRLLPHLGRANLALTAAHIIAVTLLAVGLAVAGAAMRP